MRRPWQLAIIALALSVTACGGGADSTTTSSGDSPPTTAEGGEATGDPILIGHPADFSDIYSFYDSPVRAGAELAVQEINDAGGVLGNPLEYRALDGRNDQDETLRRTQEVVDEGAVYVIGTTGDPFLAQATVACQAGVPISTGDGTAPTLVGAAGECAFHTIMSDNLQGAVAAEYALGEGYETAFLIRSTEIPYTNDLPGYFAEAFTEGGGEVIGEEEYRIDAGDYSVQVTALAALDPAPDVIYTPMFIPDTPVFMRQLRAAGVEIPVITGDGSVDASLLEAGDAVEGVVATTHAWPSEGNAVQEFFTTFEETTGSAPDSVVTGVGYDEVYIIKTAIEAAGAAEPGAIIDALATLSYEGVTGSLTMDPETRRADKEVTLVQVVEGELTFLDQFVPSFVPEVE